MIQPDKIIRSDRKTLSVCVDPFGRVTVRAPKRCDTARIFAFLEEKENWILRQKAKTAGAGMRLPPENLDGFSFLLLGKNCKISLVSGTRISYDAERGILFLPEKNARERLVKWLKENAKRILSALTEEKAREMGTAYKSVSATSAKTRWGSCSGKGRLHFSYRLIYAPEEIVDYVVVHELAHIPHKNHGSQFWAFTKSVCPDYVKKRKWLKENAFLMDIF